MTYDQAAEQGIIYREEKHDGRTVDFIGIVDFDLSILSMVRSSTAEAIHRSFGFSGVNAEVDTQRLMDVILDARDEYEVLKHEDAETAALLWQLKKQYDTIDETYLDDAFEAQFNIQGPGGYVYLFTSAHLNAVKIGHWGGTDEDLRKRYTTYFGSSLSLEVLQVANRKAVEKHLHGTFAEFRLENELFRKDKYDEYYRCFDCMRVQLNTATTPESVVDAPKSTQADIPIGHETKALEATSVGKFQVFGSLKSIDSMFRCS